MPDISVINLQEFWQTCQRCTNYTRSRTGWPYYEDFIIGAPKFWQEPGGFVPVCACCYLELLAAEAVAA
jgi:hypothetical protein